MKTLLCCIGKEENKYAREFVEHYKNLGITNICLYDNNDDGGNNTGNRDGNGGNELSLLALCLYVCGFKSVKCAGELKI